MFEVRPLLQDGVEKCYVGVLKEIPIEFTHPTNEILIATVSHELRTPLTSVKGAIDMLRSGDLGELSTKAKQTLQIAQRNVERMKRLTDDLLDLQRADAGQIDPAFKVFDLSGLVRQSIEDNAEYARTCNVDLKANTYKNAWVSADRDQILQVLANLISNAAKASPADSTVLVSMLDRGSSHRISVIDHGCGVPLAQQAKLFTPFATSMGTVNGIKGSGLGLSLSQSLIEAHAGDIGFESVQDHGSVFHFDLPKAKR